MAVETAPNFRSNSGGGVPYVELRDASGIPGHVKTLHFENGEVTKDVPVFDSRNDSHHRLIAEQYANYKIGVVFGVGLYGTAAAVESPRVGKHPDSKRAFWKVKADRSELDKIPLYLHPMDLAEIMDVEKIHEEFVPYVKDRKAREHLYRSAVAGHLIVPVKDDYPHLDPVFITKPEDWGKKGAPKDQWIDAPTASVFWWDDPDQEKIYQRTKSLNPNAFSGISSFNDHGQEPAWDLQGVIQYVKEKGRCPFDFVVTDEENERKGVKSSHPQIAIPLKGEEPIWKVYRTGSTDIDAFLSRLGSRHGYRVVEGAKQASRGHAKDVNLDSLVLDVYRSTLQGYETRHPKKTGIRAFFEKMVA